MTVPPKGRAPSAVVHELAPELVDDLKDWQVHLHAGSFTRVVVDMLLRDLRRSAPSALGYTLVLVSAPGLPEVSITATDGRLPVGCVRSTLTFALPVAHDLAACVTFYAAEDGAFDRLALLLRRSPAFGAGPVGVGGPLHEDVEPGVRGLADHTRVNHAFGVLLGRGKSVEQAEEHLHRLTARYGSVQAAAEHVLGALHG